LIERKGLSLAGVRNELFRKGISKEIVNNVVESLDFDPILHIIDLLNTKYSRSLSDEKGIKRTVASLQRLGYRWSDISAALRRIETETEDIYDV
ncbi:MAG: regulatory protein RecX, partial [Acutalibacteraceae bacterium]